MVFGRRPPPDEPKGSQHVAELPIPGGAFGADSKEVLRAWIVDRGLQVSLQRGFEDPRTWGILLVDIARHVARVYASEGAMSEEEALAAIKSLFDAEWTNMTDPGTTGRARQ